MVAMLSRVLLRTQPDVKLASLAARGSEAAFEAIVHRYRRPLLTYCRRLLRSETRGEDVVQQVFLNAWAALRGGTQVRDVRSWLYQIAHNVAVSVLRRAETELDELSETQCGLTTPEGELDQRMLTHDALAALAALPELQHKAMLRTAVEGYTYQEVATELGITDTAVRGLVYRARSTLRQALGAFTPPPAVAWAAGQGHRGASLGEIVAGGGSAGAAAVVLKGTGIVVTSAVIVGGALSGATNTPHRPLGTDQRPTSAAHATATATPSRPVPIASAARIPEHALRWRVPQAARLLTLGVGPGEGVWRRTSGNMEPALSRPAPWSTRVLYARPREPGPTSAAPMVQPEWSTSRRGSRAASSVFGGSSRIPSHARSSSQPMAGGQSTGDTQRGVSWASGEPSTTEAPPTPAASSGVAASSGSSAEPAAP